MRLNFWRPFSQTPANKTDFVADLKPRAMRGLKPCPSKKARRAARE